MRQHKIFFVFLFLFFAAGTSLPAGASFPSVGESIAYEIHFGLVAGGTSRNTIDFIDKSRGRPAFHIVMEMESSKMIDALHKVRDRRESWMDTGTLMSLRYDENVNEGSYRKNSTTLIDPSTLHLTHSYKTNKHSGQTETQAPEGVQDPVSIVYFLRTRDLQVGQEYEIPLHNGGELQMVKVRVEETETVKTPAGKFDCFHIKPILNGGEKTEGAQLEMWVTRDERRIPVLMKSKLSFGSFSAEMTEYTPGK